MNLRQAIVRCDPEPRERKRVVSKSDGIDSQLEQALCQWTAAPHELSTGKTESINFFQPASDIVAISRNFVGAREHPGKLDRPAFHHVLLLDREQIGCFDNNVMLPISWIESMGDWILPEKSQPDLPRLAVGLPAIPSTNQFVGQECSRFCAELVRAVSIHQQVVVFGEMNSKAFMGAFLSGLPAENRLDYTFSTGLNLSDDRPFTVQFFADCDWNLERELAKRQLRTMQFKIPIGAR